MQKKPIAWWILPTIFYAIHFFAVLVFALVAVPITGPEANASSMVWIAWMYLDFPIGFPAVLLAESFSTNTSAVLTIALIGGIQWIIWGYCITALVRRVQQRKRK